MRSAESTKLARGLHHEWTSGQLGFRLPTEVPLREGVSGPRVAGLAGAG